VWAQMCTGSLLYKILILPVFRNFLGGNFTVAYGRLWPTWATRHHSLRVQFPRPGEVTFLQSFLPPLSARLPTYDTRPHTDALRYGDLPYKTLIPIFGHFMSTACTVCTHLQPTTSIYQMCWWYYHNLDPTSEN